MTGYFCAADLDADLFLKIEDADPEFVAATA